MQKEIKYQYVGAINRFGVILLTIIIFCFSCNKSDSNQEVAFGKDVFGVTRTVSNHSIYSAANPERVISVGQEFLFIGRFNFNVKANAEFPEEIRGLPIAAGERIIFAHENAGIVEKVIIFQFEGFLKDNEFTYNYSFANADSISGIPYRNNVWFYNDGQYSRENTEGVAARTRALIESKNLKYPDEIIMSRIVMVTDSARRHELIISYIETADLNGVNLNDWENNTYTDDFKTRFTGRMKRSAVESLTCTELN